MKPNELRLWNYVWDDIFCYRIKNIGFHSVWGEIIDIHDKDKADPEDFVKTGYYHLDIEYIEGILLTEEWLKKLGFKYSEERSSMSNGFEEWEQNGIFLGPLDNEYFIIDALDQGGINVKIKHVHQLQNLYFALTGNELTIKL